MAALSPGAAHSAQDVGRDGAWHGTGLEIVGSRPWSWPALKLRLRRMPLPLERKLSLEASALKTGSRKTGVLEGGGVGVHASRELPPELKVAEVAKLISEVLGDSLNVLIGQV